VSKRICDLLLSLLILAMFSPVILLLVVIIKICLGNPVFFRQQRPGLNGKAFDMIKFRTMLDSTDSKGELLPDAARMTRLGTFLRNSSLDESPELWNVLKGDMSLVGPRPLLMEYLPLYNQEQRRRHEVRPGITGWAQINGRNSLSWEDKFKLDVWYVDNHSFGGDLIILLQTAKTIVMKEGISADNHVTMERFTGNE